MATREIPIDGYGFYVSNIDIPWNRVNASFPCLEPVFTKYGINDEKNWIKFRRDCSDVDGNLCPIYGEEYVSFLAMWLSAMVSHYAGYEKPVIRFEPARDDKLGWAVIFPNRAVWDYTKVEMETSRRIRGLMEVAAHLLNDSINCGDIEPTIDF